MSVTMEQLTFLGDATMLSTYNQHLRFLLSEDVITAKQHKRYTKNLKKYNVDGVYDDMDEAEDLNDLIEEMEHAYNQAQRKTKAKKVVTTLTEEEKAELLKQKRMEFINSYGNIEKYMTASVFDKAIKEYGDIDFKTIYKSIIGKAMDEFFNELEGVSIKNTSFTKRADGTSGANHQYYCHPESAYQREADGKPLTLEAEIGRGGKQATCVPLNSTESSTSGHFVIEQFSDLDKFCAIESVCEDTNEDGLRQVYKKPLTFNKNPEWKGEGFCKCATHNKKFNMFLREKVDGVWVKTQYETPSICCNMKAGANGMCKRHAKDTTGKTKEWVELGHEYTCKQIN